MRTINNFILSWTGSLWGTLRREMTWSDLLFHNGLCLWCEEFTGQVVGEGRDIELGSQADNCISQDGLSNAMVKMFHVLLLCHTYIHYLEHCWSYIWDKRDHGESHVNCELFCLKMTCITSLTKSGCVAKPISGVGKYSSPPRGVVSAWKPWNHLPQEATAIIKAKMKLAKIIAVEVVKRIQIWDRVERTGWFSKYEAWKKEEFRNIPGF